MQKHIIGSFIRKPGKDGMPIEEFNGGATSRDECSVQKQAPQKVISLIHMYPSANLGHNAKSATWLTYGGAPMVHSRPVACINYVSK